MAGYVLFVLGILLLVYGVAGGREGTSFIILGVGAIIASFLGSRGARVQ